MQLRSAIDNVKKAGTKEEKAAVKAAISQYSDVAYELSGLVNKVCVFYLPIFLSYNYTV